MEHVEEAGGHSGDSACALPPYSLSADTVAVIEEHTRAIAAELEVVGLINVQYAVKHGQAFVIAANPRASPTVPFSATPTPTPLPTVAARFTARPPLTQTPAHALTPHPPPPHT